MSVTEEQLEELELLRAETTLGRWVTGVLGCVDAAPPDIQEGQEAQRVARGLERGDAHFIAAAHRALPVLVAEVRRLREALGEISTACEGKELRWGSDADVARRLRLVVDYVWRVAREGAADGVTE